MGIFEGMSFSIALFLIGAIFLVLGLTGGFTVSNNSFMIQDIWARIMSSIIGVILVGVAIYHEIFKPPKSIADKPIAEKELPKGTSPSSTPDLRLTPENNLITCSEHVPIFTKGQSRLTTTMMSNALIVNFSNDQTWSGIAFVFTPRLDVREFAHLDISGIATQHFTFQIEYKVRVGGKLKIVTSSSFQSFPATMLVSTASIPLRYDGTVDEITLMFYETGEASHVTIESIRLSK